MIYLIIFLLFSSIVISGSLYIFCKEDENELIKLFISLLTLGNIFMVISLFSSNFVLDKCIKVEKANRVKVQYLIQESDTIKTNYVYREEN